MPATVPAERFGKRSLLVGAGALVLGVVIAGLAFWALKPAVRSQSQPVTRTVISLPPDQRPSGTQDLYPLVLALSPDGTRLVYAGSDRTGRVQLYLRPLDSMESRPISGTEEAYSPFFSPDGQWLGFFQSGGILKKISINGGAAVTLTNSSLASTGASWGSHGTIIFGTVTQPLQQISDEGGIPQTLTRLEQGDLTHRWPDVLPGGKAVLFDTGSEAASQIAAYSLTTGQKRNLGLAGTYPRYASSGHLLYMQGSTLMAVPFDAQRLEIKGTAVPVIEGVLQGAGGAGQYSVSRTGTLAYIAGTAGTVQHNLVWVTRKGQEQVLPAPPRAYGAPRLSPDGRRIAVEVEDQIWIYDLARDTLSRLTFEGTVNQDPTWTPDGRRIAFRSNKGGARNVFWISADGSGGLEQLSAGRLQIPTSFSRNGQVLIFHELNPATQRDIWILHMGSRKAEPFLQTQFNEGGAVLSPDGRWLAYVSNESGQPEIYVQPYPGPGGKWQVSTAGGMGPVWSPTGKELFYRSGDKMMAVSVVTQPTFSADKPKVLFEGRYFNVPFPLISTAYDVSADGQKFLMVKDSEHSTSTSEINIVQNWFEELKRRVPSGTR